MRLRILSIFVLIFVIAAVAAACGGGQEEKPATLSAKVAEQAAPPAAAPAAATPAAAARLGATAAGSGAGGLSVDGLSLADRKIVYNARLEMTVADVDRAVGDVERIAATTGGFLANANVRVEKGEKEERKVADITIRVPARSYPEVLSQLRGLAARVRSETAQSSDVTEEYADLSARLRNLQATEARYVQLLAEAKNIGEIFQVQDRINATRLEIERIQGRLNLLDHLSDLATIAVHMEPVLATQPTLVEAGWSPVPVAGDAWAALLTVLRALATVAIAFVVFGWWIVILALVGALLWRRFGTARGRP